MNQMQRIISKHQHTDGLIALFPQHQMSGNISYDFGPNQGHGTLSNVSSRYSNHSVTRGHYMNASGYDGKASSYNDIYSTGFANTSLILNGGFETAGTGGADIWADWAETVGDGTLANEGVEIHTGADACKLTAGATRNTLVDNNDIPVIPGKQYRLRFWTRGDGTYAGRYGVLDLTNSAWILFATSTAIVGTTYTMVDYEFTAPALCVSIRIRLQCADTNGGVGYFDTVSLKPVSDFAFNPDAGAIITFLKTDAAWAELINRYAINLKVDNQNQIAIWKSSTADTMYARYESDGDSKLMNFDGLTWTTMNWFCVGLMWDRLVNDEVTLFLDGIQVDRGVGLEPWFGDLAATTTVIGASENDGSDGWDGGIGITAIYNEIKTDAEMLYLSKP